MLEALYDYVQMRADCMEIKLSTERKQQIAYAILEDEKVWDYVNDRIKDLIEEEE